MVRLRAAGALGETDTARGTRQGTHKEKPRDVSSAAVRDSGHNFDVAVEGGEEAHQRRSTI